MEAGSFIAFKAKRSKYRAFYVRSKEDIVKAIEEVTTATANLSDWKTLDGGSLKIRKKSPKDEL
jgi:hypothetical protein